MNRMWTADHILSILDASDKDDQDALWAGFLWNPRVSSSELYRHLKSGILNKIRDSVSHERHHTQALAYLTVLGWNSTDDGERTSWVSNEEFRDALLHGGDEFRSQVLWQFERALEADEAHRNEWRVKASEFFKDVWPRQKAVKTSAMTARICELLLSHCDTFDALFDVASPLLMSIRDGAGMHLHVRAEVEQIAKSRPIQFLQLMHKVLPDDVANWPYGIGESLEWIVEGDGTLANDTRLIELRRHWNTR